MFQGNSNAAASALTSAVSNGAPASAAAQAVAQVTSPHTLQFLERQQGHGMTIDRGVQRNLCPAARVIVYRGSSVSSVALGRQGDGTPKKGGSHCRSLALRKAP